MDGMGNMSFHDTEGNEREDEGNTRRRRPSNAAFEPSHAGALARSAGLLCGRKEPRVVVVVVVVAIMNVLYHITELHSAHIVSARSAAATGERNHDDYTSSLARRYCPIGTPERDISVHISVLETFSLLIITSV
jgi:hypothetical protein